MNRLELTFTVEVNGAPRRFAVRALCRAVRAAIVTFFPGVRVGKVEAESVNL